MTRHIELELIETRYNIVRFRIKNQTHRREGITPEGINKVICRPERIEIRSQCFPDFEADTFRKGEELWSVFYIRGDEIEKDYRVMEVTYDFYRRICGAISRYNQMYGLIFSPNIDERLFEL